MNEQFKLKGHIHITLKGADGQVKEERDINNVVVTVGKYYLATWLTAATQSDYFMSWIGLGSGTTAANASDTDLETPVDDRLQGTLSASTNIWSNTRSFGAGESTGSISEAGLFSDETSGTMFAHQVFTAIPKGASDVLDITWSITLN